MAKLDFLVVWDSEHGATSHRTSTGSQFKRSRSLYKTFNSLATSPIAQDAAGGLERLDPFESDGLGEGAEVTQEHGKTGI